MNKPFVESDRQNLVVKNHISHLQSNLRYQTTVWSILIVLCIGFAEKLQASESVILQNHPENISSISNDSECTSHATINALLGGAPWESLPAPEVNGVVVSDLPGHGDGILIHEPIIQIDKSDGTYHPNMVAPTGGEATIWFDAPIEMGDQICQGQSINLPDITQVGIAHVDPRYTFRSQNNSLIEGSDRIYELGFKAIFAYLVTAGGNESVNIYGEAEDGDPLWPDPAPTTLVELAQAAPFQHLFQKNYSTYVLTVYTTAIPAPLQGEERLSEANLADEEEQFYQLTKYLLTTYTKNNKTFILKHWEGDHIVESVSGNTSESEMTTEQQIDLIKWLQARQRGVERARGEVESQNVQVAHAIEVSRVLDVDEGKKRFINGVVPYINADLIAYSAWESTVTQRTSSELEQRLAEAINTIDRFTPNHLGLGTKRIFISEFGLKENTLILTPSIAAQWCAPRCTPNQFSPLIESDGVENIQGLLYKNDTNSCIPFMLPHGISIDAWTGTETLTGVTGPIDLPSICSASLRIGSGYTPEPSSLIWRIDQTIQTAIGQNLSYAFIWQLYDNECAQGSDTLMSGDCSGNWIIRPDGSQIGSQFIQSPTVEIYIPTMIR